jgi:hypothetical protein
VTAREFVQMYMEIFRYAYNLQGGSVMESCHVCNKKTEGLIYVYNEPDGYYICRDCLASAMAHQCSGCHNYFDDSMLYYVDSAAGACR